ncbi:hypothetical protein [Undibacterium sp. TJN19]|uniref:hypothetical protein n=1 Tax=Undibacterium sp. TJN19 TaxID=3413055 RepID=UPI003BEF7E41
MKLSQRSRLLAAFIVLFSMLFMQFALAAYTCPGMTKGDNQGNAQTQVAMFVDNATMSNCEGMDVDQPGLCHAHAQNEWSKQSLDKPSLPDVQAFMPIGVVLVIQNVDLVAAKIHAKPASKLLSHTTAPPIAIRHCCFRI